MLDRYLTLAEKWEADAAEKRQTAPAYPAETRSQMLTEAAGLERGAAELRRQVEQAEQESEDAP